LDAYEGKNSDDGTSAVAHILGIISVLLVRDLQNHFHCTCAFRKKIKNTITGTAAATKYHFVRLQ
jgi:hypothetical protein